MRTTTLLMGDIRFQFKYGFYFLYFIFTVLYIGLLFVLPNSWREKTAILMIFSDPAAMGLYFMGAIILFEKSERVLNSIAISPVKPYEYVIAKLLSIAVVSTTVSLVIGLSVGVVPNIFFFIIGVFVGSCLFSAIGLMLAANIASLNQFIISTIPMELLINLPAIAYLFGWKPRWLLFHPGVSIIELCQNGPGAFFAAFNLILWIIPIVLLACRVMTKSFQSLGGMKL